MNVSERLADYGANFPVATLDHIQEVAERQASFDTYGAYFDSVGIRESAVGARIVDVRPQHYDYDAESAVVLHLPMANPLDPNQLFSVATLASVFPNRRIIAAANPSGRGYDFSPVPIGGLRKIISGNFSPAVEGLARYLDTKRIHTVDQIGGSYGADLALALGRENLFVRSTLVIEPASVVERSLKRLGDDFKSSEAAMQGYVDAVGLATYLDARADSISGNNYLIGLVRPSNIAVSMGIAKGRFAENMSIMISEQGGRPVNLVWGSESELASDSSVRNVVVSTQRANGLNTVRGKRLEGQKHAMCNDLHLLAALAHLSVPKSA